jgi:hypothetical protein
MAATASHTCGGSKAPKSTPRWITSWMSWTELSLVTGDLAYAAMGEHARAVPVVIFQGTADALVNYPLGRTALTQWLGTNDMADDGERNGSVSLTPGTENRSFDQQPQPGSGDPCIPPPNSFPCAGGAIGFQGDYPHTIERFLDEGGEVMVEFWSIHGLGHAFPGGNPEGSFVDPLGPDVRTAAYEFFMAHPNSGPRTDRRGTFE